MKYHIEKNTVQETLVIPLYSRAKAAEIYPNLYQDETAKRIIEQIDYDFSSLKEKEKKIMYRFGYLEVAMRQNDIEIEIKDYLRTHPNAAVVNLGCDLNDTSWFNKIDASGGVVFFASGVFYYFLKEQIKSLIAKMAKRFPDGKIVFDGANKNAVKMIAKTWLKAAKIKDVNAFFAVSNARKELTSWNDKIDVSSKGYMLGYNDLKDSSISPLFRLLAKAGDKMMKMQIVRIDFRG